jgi:hypothetical protein
MRTLFLLAGKNGAESGQYWTLFYRHSILANQLALQANSGY